MSEHPGRFRDNYAECDWIFDLFAYGFDFLDGRFMPSSDEGLEDKWVAEEEEIKNRDIVSAIAKYDGGIPHTLRQYLDVPGDDDELQSLDFCVRLYSTMSAIDRAAADLNYLQALTRVGAQRWSRVSQYFERRGKQLQRNASGYVVFRPRYFEKPTYRAWSDEAQKSGEWKPVQPRGEYLGSYFANLLRVGVPSDCTLEFRILNPTQDFHDPAWTALRVGIVPMVQEIHVRSSDAQLLPGPLLVKKKTGGRPESFSIEIDGNPVHACVDLCKRAEAALIHLAGRGCQLVLFPELVMPDPVLRHVKGVLARLAAANSDRPCLTLAGTFTRMLPQYNATKPFNVGVILNDRGEELWRQRKAQPYDMYLHEQRRFGLDSLLKSDPCRENIAFMPRTILSVDSRAAGMRIMVLICEDLTREPGTKAVRDLQPTLVLTPVMAGPLESSSGFARSIDELIRLNDGIFVVANSAALAKAAWGKTSGNPPLGLIGLPLLNAAQEFRPFEPISETEAVPGMPDVQVLYYQFPA